MAPSSRKVICKSSSCSLEVFCNKEAKLKKSPSGSALITTEKKWRFTDSSVSPRSVPAAKLFHQSQSCSSLDSWDPAQGLCARRPSTESTPLVLSSQPRSVTAPSWSLSGTPMLVSYHRLELKALEDLLQTQ